MSKLDDVSWHLGNDQFPPDAPEENAATHIGMFVAWAIGKDLWGTLPGVDWSEAVRMVKDRKTTGRTFLLEQCDGKLLSEMMTPEGASFAKDYYPRTYLKDFQRILAKGLASDYLVKDDWNTFDCIAAEINARYEKAKRKPWWKLW
jgi:hypothetical protein